MLARVSLLMSLLTSEGAMNVNVNVGWQMTSSPPRIFHWRKSLLLPCSESLSTWQTINFHPPGDFIKEVNVLVSGHFVTKPLHPQHQRKGLGHYQRKENWEQRRNTFFRECSLLGSVSLHFVVEFDPPHQFSQFELGSCAAQAASGRMYCIYEFWATVAQFLSFILPPHLPWV